MPLYVAGQRIRGSEINALPQVYRVASPQFSPNSAVLKDLTGLAFQGDANAWYLVECYIVYHANAATDIQFAWSLPGDYVVGNGAAGTGSWWTAVGVTDTAGASGVGDVDLSAGDSLTLALKRGGSDATALLAELVAFVQMGPTAGTVKLRWAQQNPTTHPTTIRVGSCMRVSRMA